MKLMRKALRFLRRDQRPDRESFGLHELDVRLLEYLPQSGGFFVEGGANDGVNQSNTLYLERYLGWKGLLIEPIPELAEKCRQNRKQTPVAQCALVSADFSEATIEIRDCNLMSVVKGGMSTEEEEQEHLEQGRQVQGLDKIRSIMVPARTLSSLLDEHKVNTIDFLSLDVEGYEAQALRGLDLNRHRPHWILVEARYKADIDDVLRGHYEEVAVLSPPEVSPHDVLYKLKG